MRAGAVPESWLISELSKTKGRFLVLWKVGGDQLYKMSLSVRSQLRLTPTVIGPVEDAPFVPTNDSPAIVRIDEDTQPVQSVINGFRVLQHNRRIKAGESRKVVNDKFSESPRAKSKCGPACFGIILVLAVHFNIDLEDIILANSRRRATFA